IEPNYLEDFKYLTVDVEEDIELIRARYINANHHLDLPATVMNLLGIEADPSIHSYGGDMLSPDFNRTYTVASDWHGNALITPELKMVFSKKSAANSASTTSLDDEPMSLAEAGTGYRSVLERFTRELSRLYNLQRRP